MDQLFRKTLAQAIGQSIDGGMRQNQHQDLTDLDVSHQPTCRLHTALHRHPPRLTALPPLLATVMMRLRQRPSHRGSVIMVQSPGPRHRQSGKLPPPASTLSHPDRHEGHRRWPDNLSRRDDPGHLGRVGQRGNMPHPGHATRRSRFAVKRSGKRYVLARPRCHGVRLCSALEWRKLKALPWQRPRITTQGVRHAGPSPGARGQEEGPMTPDVRAFFDPEFRRSGGKNGGGAGERESERGEGAVHCEEGGRLI